MPRTFSFRMKEKLLRDYSERLKQLREENPLHCYVVVFTVDLIPDGDHFKILSPPRITIDDITDEVRAIWRELGGREENESN